MASEKTAKIEILEQEGILEKRLYEVDPKEVLVNGITLEEMMFSYKRESKRTGVIS
jgi:hypothetical protein